MSTLYEVSVLEQEVNIGNFDLADKISSLRTLLLEDDNKNRFSSKEAKAVAHRIWNITVKLQRIFPTSNASDSSTLRLLIIPQLRILTVDIYQKYTDKNNNEDGLKLLYFLCYSYKSLLDADNYTYAEQYLEKAFKLYPQLNSSSHSALTLVQLKIWQVQHEITQSTNYDKALMMIKEFTTHFKIISSNLISFIYEKTVENKSIDWCEYCLSLADNSLVISNEMKNRIETLLAQLYLNNFRAEQAMHIIPKLPKSPNKVFLELKCLILLSPKDPTLKERLIDFISTAKEDRRILIALCLFIADNCEKMDKTCIDFIIEVVKTSNTISEIDQRKHIYISSIKIVSAKNDLDSATSLLKIINSTESIQHDSDMLKKEIAKILWNRALDSFYGENIEEAIQWMQLCKSQVNEIEFDHIQSSCFRFISHCYFELKKYTESLHYVNEAIQKQPNCCYGYLLKFRILNETGSESESFNLINELLNNSPYLEEFPQSFFTSIATELHSKGNDSLSLEILLKFYQLNFNSTTNKIDDNETSSFVNIHFSPSENENKAINNIKRSTIRSIFALLQASDDFEQVSNALNTLASRWKTLFDDIKANDAEASLQQSPFFIEDEISTFSAIAFSNGLEMKKKKMLTKAIQSFLSGSIFSDNLIENKAPCIFEAIDCYISLLPQATVTNQDLKESPLSQAKSLLDQIATEIDNANNLDEKFREGLLLAKLKINLIEKSQDNDLCHFTKELIEDITSPTIFREICEFIIDHHTSQDVIHSLLDRAKVIDKINNQSQTNDNLILSLTATLLYQLVMNSNTAEESRNIYDLVLEFVLSDNASLMSSSQLQFFMSHAWNIGVNCAQLFQQEDAEWWLKTALRILTLSDELKSLYFNELNEKYSKFARKSESSSDK